MFTRTLYILLITLTTVCGLSAAELEWDQTEVSIEMEPDQEEARAVFTVTNKGEKAVRIARIKTSCGCTGSIVDRKIIEPGKSTEIIGTFHKGKRQGLNRNRLQVFLDNQPDAVATLVMVVKIPTLIEAMPQIVYWSKDSNQSERKIRITMDERYINKINDIKYDEKRLKVREEAGEAGSDTDLILAIEPLDYSTLYRGSIIIKASGPGGRKHESNVHVFVQP